MCFSQVFIFMFTVFYVVAAALFLSKGQNTSNPAPSVWLPCLLLSHAPMKLTLSGARSNTRGETGWMGSQTPHTQ